MLQLLLEAGASLRVMDREDRSPLYLGEQYFATSASKSSIRRFVITEKAPTHVLILRSFED